MNPLQAKYILVFTVILCLYSARLLGQTAVPETFTELPDPIKSDESKWSALAKGLHSSFVSIDKRYAKSELPEIEKQNRLKLMGWKGEVLSAQILLWTHHEAPEVQVDISDFITSSGQHIARSSASARFVRYVMTDEFAEGCGYRNPADYAASLSPDMLDDLADFDVPANSARPVWLSVSVPRDAPAGVYNAQVSVTGPTTETQQLHLELEVVDQVLPEPRDWTYHLDQWQHPSAVARVAGLKVWSEEHFQAMRPVMKLLADAGQKAITTTLNKDPWNVQTYDPYQDMITWTKTQDGAWDYDYAVFDQWVQFMMSLGIDDMINCYSIIPWNNEIHYYDEGKQEQINVEAKPGTALFAELWTPFLEDFVRHLKDKKWLEITNIAMDEREREQMDAALSLLKRVAPELGVSYADNQKTYQRYPDSEDISISVGHPFSKKDLLDRQARGLITTFYICCSDAFPNQFTFSEPAESTYLAWYALANGFDGMLRWAYNSWVENPLHDSRFRSWPAGDTYIVYPKGRSSIRYERLREGIQDYEKARIVLSYLEEQGRSKELEELHEAIARLSANERHKYWNQYLNQAKVLLNELAKSL